MISFCATTFVSLDMTRTDLGGLRKVIRAKLWSANAETDGELRVITLANKEARGVTDSNSTILAEDIPEKDQT
jgi:hypothetical protein